MHSIQTLCITHEDPSELTARELEVVEHLARGQSYEQIGHALCIIVNTVKAHLHHVYAKAKVASRAEAAEWYWREIAQNG